METTDPVVDSVCKGIDISPNKDGGVMKVIKKEGEGEETPGIKSDVYVHYTGTLENGEKFDSSHDRGTHFKFTLGLGQVIKGWDIGVATMKKGEICVLTCTSEYAYGDQGSPPKIPPKATLIFEIELDHWEDKDLTEDGGVIMKTITEGEGYSKPNQDASVSIHMRGSYNGRTFEERDVQFTLGEGNEHGICPGIEKALYEMKLHQKVKLTIDPRYGLNDKRIEEFGLPSHPVIEYEIYLSSFEKAMEHWEMDLDQKLETSAKIKEKGSKYFKEGDIRSALNQYEKMIKILDVWKEEEKEKTKSLKCIAHLNAALCHIKLKEYAKAKDNSDKALEIEKSNVKGLFRRGQAHMGLYDYDLAKKDFASVLNLEPTNKAAKDQMHQANIQIKKQLEKEKKLYGNIFKKMAMEDEKVQEKMETESNTEIFKDAYDKAVKEEEMVTDTANGDATQST